MKFDTNIKHFQIDKNRDKIYVDVEFYQMNLTSAVNLAKQDNPDLFVEDDDFLPSWTKTLKNPIKAKGFITTTFQSIFEAKHNLDELNVDLQFDEVRAFRVDMMFVPGSTKNKNLKIFCDIVQQSLTNTMVVQINGDETTNGMAEKHAKVAIEKAKKLGQNVLFISAGMAQRSFSVGEINTVYLAYDGGSADATAQKLSRALTPFDSGKIGRIVSLSFDPNRDDKFDDILLQTTVNLAENKNISINEAVKTVLRTISLKYCTEDGAQLFDKDVYLDQLIENNRLDRVIGRVADLSTLSKDQLRSIAEGKVDHKTLSKTNKTDSGKTHKKNESSASKGKREENEERKLILEARKVITTIAENIDILMAVGGETIDEMLSILDDHHEYYEEVHSLFDMKYDTLKNIINGVINKNLLELKYRD